MGKAAIGIDVGGTNLRVARVSDAGEILESRSERISRNPNVALERIISLSKALNQSDVQGIGIGVPGRVDNVARLVLSGGFLDLASVDLVETLEAETGRPVVLDSDCNMALIAEMRIGAATGNRHVVMLTIGTGIGGAIALDGEIVRGRASGGQLGHLTVVHDGLPCACGRRGCIETTSSGTALGKLLADAGLMKGTRIETLLQQATNDELSARIVNSWGAPLRDAIDSLVATLDPELVLLGGGLGHAACLALASLPARSPWYQCPIHPAALGDDAGVVGGALAALARSALDGAPFSRRTP
jgi:glucokinase